ncbi:MAG: 23S rRNA (adenine(2503)-C(2))-methyltransferase RlmN [bacterium]
MHTRAEAAQERAPDRRAGEASGAAGRSAPEDPISRELPLWEERVAGLGEPRFRAGQVFAWIHKKGILRPDRMGNLPGSLRERLADEPFSLAVSLERVLTSRDRTRKFLFRLEDGLAIEAVLIPEAGRLTLCLSTQVGCRMRCAFCRTGGLGFERNLRAGEILGQHYAIRSLLKDVEGGPAVTHIVFMGMGEPLDNLEETRRALRILSHPLGCGMSLRRMTVSTVGIPAGLETLFLETPVSITVSLNAADDETRSRIMPVNRRYPLGDVLETLRRLPLPPRRRFTIAYVLLRGVNDSPEDARRLVRLLHGIRCKVNLIPFNPFPGTELQGPEESGMLAFQALLRSKGVSAHVRQSRGSDILGACGQLAGDRPDV